jgi:hypothetical protein
MTQYEVVVELKKMNAVESRQLSADWGPLKTAAKLTATVD